MRAYETPITRHTDIDEVFRMNSNETEATRVSFIRVFVSDRIRDLESLVLAAFLQTST